MPETLGKCQKFLLIMIGKRLYLIIVFPEVLMIEFMRFAPKPCITPIICHHHILKILELFKVGSGIPFTAMEVTEREP